jgi:hypothetical protein
MSRRGARATSFHLASTGIAFAGSLLTAGVLGAGQAAEATTGCAALVTLSIPNTTITSATMVPATDTTPAYCNVLATVAPQTDIRLQLPSNWKDRYLHLGGGGFDGNIPTNAPAAYNVNLLGEGYAIGASNGGHRAAQYPGPTFAGNQQLVLGYAYTAIGDTDTVARALIQAYYGKPAHYRYFDGCSNGGKNASVAASRFRKDYDGVIGGDGVWGHADDHVGGGDMAGLTAVWARVVNATSKVNPATFPAKLTALYNAQLAKCDAQDGLADGIISNPRKCRFDPAALACTGGVDTPSCLNPTELAAVKTLQSDLVLDRQVIGAPFAVGNLVSGLSAVVGGGQALGQGFLAMAYNNPAYAISSFNLERDFAFISNQFGKVDDMTGALRGIAKYVSEGGKLIVWTGAEDPLVPPLGSLRFVQRLREASEGGFDNVRLYDVPGVNHCGGGPGADSINLLTPIANWVEKGVPPTKLIASKLNTAGAVTFTRPLCPFPEWAKYTGGPASSASSFRCVRSDDDDHHRHESMAH